MNLSAPRPGAWKASVGANGRRQHRSYSRQYSRPPASHSSRRTDGNDGSRCPRPKPPFPLIPEPTPPPPPRAEEEEEAPAAAPAAVAAAAAAVARSASCHMHCHRVSRSSARKPEGGGVNICVGGGGEGNRVWKVWVIVAQPRDKY